MLYHSQAFPLFQGKNKCKCGTKKNNQNQNIHFCNKKTGTEFILTQTAHNFFIIRLNHNVLLMEMTNYLYFKWVCFEDALGGVSLCSV